LPEVVAVAAEVETVAEAAEQVVILLTLIIQ
jgi:hypothetical protein